MYTGRADRRFAPAEVTHGSSAILTGVFFGTAFATILTPGPNMVYVGTTGGERGPATGMLASVAVTVGGVCYTLATAIGISAAMAAYPAVFTTIRIAGIVYLVYLGLKQLDRARDTAPLPPARDDGGRAFRTGLVISLTNPQLATFFLAFLPQFIVPGDGPVWSQFLRLGLTFNACALLVTTLVALITGFAGKAPVGGVRFRQVMRAVAGLAFIAVAVKSAVGLLR
jgi:threonine/homoserine/homoserine lactone efflux protein